MTSSLATRAMLFAALTLCLYLANGTFGKTVASDPSLIKALEASLDRGHATLNEMFREVEKLMEDTQHTLREAVHQMDNETAKLFSHTHGLPKKYHNDTGTEVEVENKSNHSVDEIDKEKENETARARLSHFEADGRWNEVDHECMIDEDCDGEGYCLYEILSSKCLPCKLTHTPCTKDEECCSTQLCIWGQCSGNSTKGQSGSICQHQTDCAREHCCAFHQALLFPVCTVTLGEGERCQSPSNLLLDLLSWELEGPTERCPCGRGLQCQPNGRGSVCVEKESPFSEEEQRDLLT